MIEHEYFRGNLVLARFKVGEYQADADEGSEPAAEMLTALWRAEEAWRAYERGGVHLVQIRHGKEDYSYLAIPRP